MGKQSSLPYADRLRRLISLTYGARQNAAQAMGALAGRDDPVVVHGADLALLAGHPAGLSKARAAGRLGTALWEVFPGHVALLDRSGVVVSVNRAWRQSGLANGSCAAAGLGMNYLELCRRAAAEGEPEAAEAAELIRAALSGDGDLRRLAYPVDSPAGHRWFSLQVIAIPGRFSGALVVHEDITTDKQREEELRHRAFHDGLTGLPNRALLADRLEHAVAGAARDPESLAVLFIDLDDFKTVNDRFGHLAGDGVLRQTAQNMVDCVRASDTVGRWGGDEFVIIAERLDGTLTADELARRIAARLQEPMAINGQMLQVSASIGVARLDRHKTPERLVEAADQALITERRNRRMGSLRPEG